MHTLQEHGIEDSELYQNFNNNCFVYGITKFRSTIRKALEEKTGIKTVYVDDLINKIIVPLTDFDGNFVGVNSEKYGKVFDGLSEQEREFLNHLMNVQDHKLRIQTPIDTSGFYDDDDQQIERACKAALSYKKRILFCIDYIDLRQAFDRNYSISQPRTRAGVCIYDCFTSAEIRYIKKHWDALKDNITFYRNGEKLTKLPWEMLNDADQLGANSVYHCNAGARIVPQTPRKPKRKRLGQREDPTKRRKKLTDFWKKLDNPNEVKSKLLEDEANAKRKFGIDPPPTR